MISRTDNKLVYVAPSSIHGEGLFATSELKAGQLVGFYEGDTVANDDENRDDMHILWIEEEDDYWVGYDGKNSMRFMNHSDRPNAQMHGRECYALIDISPRQEITIDYGWGET
jgi:SET domain-containing protein